MHLLITAATEAQRLGVSIAGPELVLLALLRREDCDAATILRDLGLDAAELESRLLSRDDESVIAERPINFPPVMYTLQGRAEAFAVALGVGRITAEHVLLALLWDTHPQVGSDDGSDIRPVILERLAAAGHSVPQSDPPPLAPAWTQRVVVDDAEDADVAFDHLVNTDLHGWGWNVNERGTHWFVALNTSTFSRS